MVARKLQLVNKKDKQPRKFGGAKCAKFVRYAILVLMPQILGVIYNQGPVS
jgi:hypothetical protein